jgi:hypothetical protein
MLDHCFPILLVQFIQFVNLPFWVYSLEKRFELEAVEVVPQLAIEMVAQHQMPDPHLLLLDPGLALAAGRPVRWRVASLYELIHCSEVKRLHFAI